MAEYAFFLQKADQWRKENISICPLLCWFQLPYDSQAELSSLNGLKAWGEDKNSAMTLLFSLCGQRMKWQELEILVCQLYGWTLARPGFPPWRKWLGNWLPVSPVNLIGHMPWCSCMRAPVMCHTLRRGTWASYPSKGQRQLPAGESAN